MDLRSFVRASLAGDRRRRPLLNLVVASLVAVALVASLASLAVAATTGFPDVPATHPYYAAITDLASRAIISGKTDGKFYPSDPVTRQQFAKMAVLAGAYPVSEADLCPFLDVEVSGPGSFYPDNYVAVCAARGITQGVTPASFNPMGDITRLQVTSMVVRMADELSPGLLAAPPDGWTSSGTWSLDATHGANAVRAEYNQLLAGLDLAALSPTGPMTRGEVAQVLHNLLARLATVTTTTTTAAPTTTLSPTTTSSPTTSSSSTTTTVSPGPGSSFDDPIPLGGWAIVGSWTVQIMEVDLNATEEILDWDELNDPPEAEYALITVKLTYSGEGSKKFVEAMDVKLHGVLGGVFGQADAAIPDDLREKAAVGRYGSQTGNLVFDVEPSMAGHGCLEFEEKGDTTHATRTFFSLW